MTVKQELEAELAAVAGSIETARAALSRDEIVEIREIPERMREVANGISDLPPEDAIEMRPALVSLLSDFKRFGEELQAKIEDIETAKAAENNSDATTQSGG